MAERMVFFENRRNSDCNTRVLHYLVTMVLTRMSCVSMLLQLAFLFTSSVASISSSASRSDRNEWIQVSPTIQFQVNQKLDINNDNNQKMDGAVEQAFHRMLSFGRHSSTSNFSPYSNGMHLSGEEWDSYQLAWRLLGFYVDCSYNNREQCQRHVLYAVYVDPDYEGNGISEYEYYDRDTGEFVCYNVTKGACRAKMDCHLTDTAWQLLGVFKIDSVSEGNGWMEQLFKHEGVCVWGENTYKIASQMREEIPNGCKETDVSDNSGNRLYYDMKPGRNGTLTLGLYSDSVCSEEYEGHSMNVFQVTGHYQSDFDEFNEALDVWKICQPCVSYSLANFYNDFQCNDQAGYTNCNQCMKFSAKSGCQIATSRDITLAQRQQTIVPFTMHGSVVGAGGSDRVSTASAKYAAVEYAGRENGLFLKSCAIFFFACLAMFAVSSWAFKENGHSLSNDDDWTDSEWNKTTTAQAPGGTFPNKDTVISEQIKDNLEESRSNSSRLADVLSESVTKDYSAAESKSATRETENPDNLNSSGGSADPNEAAAVSHEDTNDSIWRKKGSFVGSDIENYGPTDATIEKTPSIEIQLVGFFETLSRSISGKDDKQLCENDKKEPILGENDKREPILGGNDKREPILDENESGNNNNEEGVEASTSNNPRRGWLSKIFRGRRSQKRSNTNSRRNG